ncbi:hypothetical protein [Micromonospora sp. NPDC005113]
MADVAAHLPVRRGLPVPGAAPHSHQQRSLAVLTVHGPVLPLWSCGGCDRPWPCRIRQGELRAEFDGVPVSLALYMSAQLARASEDLSHVPAGALHRRFLGWVR